MIEELRSITFLSCADDGPNTEDNVFSDIPMKRDGLRIRAATDGSVEFAICVDGVYKVL